MIQRIIIYIEIFDRLLLNYVSFDLKRKKGKTEKNNKETHDSKDNYPHRNMRIHDYHSNHHFSPCRLLLNRSFDLQRKGGKKGTKKKRKGKKGGFKSWDKEAHDSESGYLRAVPSTLELRSRTGR